MDLGRYKERTEVRLRQKVHRIRCRTLRMHFPLLYLVGSVVHMSQHHVAGFLESSSHRFGVRDVAHLRITKTLLSDTKDEDQPKADTEGVRKKSVGSKDRAISALSQPQKNGGPLPVRRRKNKRRDGKRGPSSDSSWNRARNQKRDVSRRESKDRRRGKPDQLGFSSGSDGKNSKKTPRGSSRNKNVSYSSLLPPPLTSPDEDDLDDPLVSGLSSWEEFLGAGKGDEIDTSSPGERTTRSFPKGESRSKPSGNSFITKSAPRSGLPSIQDLFPHDLSSSASPTAQEENERYDQTNSPKSLDGALPVSDLFYRSSANEDHDDEELPFSAEQSDSVSSENNKVRIRRNLAGLKAHSIPGSETGNTRRRGRKMVRRGMEMLVGGVPVNADPPQRSLDLVFDKERSWDSTVSLNTRAFGPFWSTSSLPKLLDEERRNFLEYWARSSLKWDVCPRDLRQICKSYVTEKRVVPVTSVQSVTEDEEPMRSDGKEKEELSDQNVGKPLSLETERKPLVHNSVEVTASSTTNPSAESMETLGQCSFEMSLSRDDIESSPMDVFKSVFASALLSIISSQPLEHDLKGKESELVVDVPDLFLTETDGGYTDVHVNFKIIAKTTAPASPSALSKRTKGLNELLQRAMDDGDIAVALASAAQSETRWSEAFRERFVEECLFQDDVLEDEDISSVSDTLLGQSDGRSTPVADFSEESDESEHDQSGSAREDLFLGGGNDGIFYDFSVGNSKSAPFGGQVGLRLTDAVLERAKERHPRVIAIGDVHGCIDELQSLLRECDYRPGDLVVLLGDLVCKGPDSMSVVQMAREIGAIGVRGNHDFEVVRWHQAIKSGVDPPIVGSEHFHIASCLSKADMKWMHSLPWYISSKDLSTLFVHAGFVSGIRLAKQNPRLMMNMRSILPDGTVTSKFFNNWPWARLWDGPQTVLFGHDADRGLQQYEHAIGLDTGCVYGGRLTACILPEKRLVSVSARREYFKYRRKHYD